jgi:undecaprenyl-diphosphatase
MNYILALVQGITEFLPVSSSGHLNLFQSIFNHTPSLSLNIYFHLATLFSVLFFFRNKGKDFIKNIPYLVVATLPTVFVAFFFKNTIDVVFENIKFLPYCFLFTSLILFSSKFIKNRNEKMNFKKAIIVGLVQAFAILPGISRSASTIAAALLLGLSPLAAFTFSFYLFIPASLGATILEYSHLNFNINVLLPFILCFVTGVIALNILKKSIISKKFYLFSIYTLLLSLLLFFII